MPTDLPSYQDVAIDDYWVQVEKLNLFPNLCSLVKIALTCFNGPKVEGAFTLMNMTSTEYHPSLAVSTLSASLSAQYHAKVYGPAVSRLSQNHRCTPVDPNLLRCMRTAWKKCEKD